MNYKNYKYKILIPTIECQNLKRLVPTYKTINCMITNIIESVLAAEKLFLIQVKKVDDDYISGKTERISFVYMLIRLLDRCDY